MEAFNKPIIMIIALAGFMALAWYSHQQHPKRHVEMSVGDFVNAKLAAYKPVTTSQEVVLHELYAQKDPTTPLLKKWGR